MRVTDDRARWDKLVRDVEELTRTRVVVGVRGDSPRVEGGNAGASASVRDYAHYNEFGTETIPARPYIRPVADNGRAQIRRYMLDTIGSVVRGTSPPVVAAGILGERVVGMIRQRILTSGGKYGAPFAPNAASTVRRKGSSKPLIDTGTLIRAIDYETERGGRRR